MPDTSRMQWPYPARDTDPWFAKFDDMVTAMDASGFAAREDRHLILAEGGNFSWDLAAQRLAWDATLEIISPIAGFRNDVVANSVTMEEGDFLYVNLDRALTNNVTVAPMVGAVAPSTNAAYTICVRRNDEIFFKIGERLIDGQSRSLFGPRSGSVGQKEIVSLNIANRVTGDATTPLSVGAVSFDPSDHDMAGRSQSIFFRAVASNGNDPLLTHVKLVNVTDAEDVVTLDFTSPSLVKQEASLVLGSGPGQIDAGPHIYEVEIFLDASPAVGDTIELYSTGLRVVNTIV